MKAQFFTLLRLIAILVLAAGFGSAVARQSLDSVTLSSLPPEAKRTLQLIKQGGPFPYPKKDGSTFGNYEKRLPYQLELVPLPIPAETKAELRARALIGKVPVLAHGELWLTESLAISEYLAETFPAPGSNAPSRSTSLPRRKSKYAG